MFLQYVGEEGRIVPLEANMMEVATLLKNI